MAMKDYKVTFADGTETFYQFEDDDPGLEALQAAAKDKGSDVESVATGTPQPINKGASK
jgi:hypothetical protein